jgi:hypothetical protein
MRRGAFLLACGVRGGPVPGRVTWPGVSGLAMFLLAAVEGAWAPVAAAGEEGGHLATAGQVTPPERRYVPTQLSLPSLPTRNPDPGLAFFRRLALILNWEEGEKGSRFPHPPPGVRARPRRTGSGAGVRVLGGRPAGVGPASRAGPGALAVPLGSPHLPPGRSEGPRDSLSVPGIWQAVESGPVGARGYRWDVPPDCLAACHARANAPAGRSFPRQ